MVETKRYTNRLGADSVSETHSLSVSVYRPSSLDSRLHLINILDSSLYELTRLDKYFVSFVES